VIPRSTGTSALQCPHCQQQAGSDVTDSRASADYIRRRRTCGACQRRFTTYELIVDPLVFERQRGRAKAVAAQLREMASTLEVW